MISIYLVNNKELIMELGNNVDISQLLSQGFNQKPIFDAAEIKCIALGNIMNNMAINKQRGRTTFASNIAKDINVYQGLAGGVDMNALMFFAMMQGQQQPKIGEPKPVATVDEIVDKVLDRLDAIIESRTGEQP
jgi:hypothetical protein